MEFFASVFLNHFTIKIFTDSNQENSIYSFGYSNDLSARQESMSLDGTTRGFYSYVDANGDLQRVDYIADPVKGYQVLQNPVVQDTPEVAAAKAQFFKLYQEVSKHVG